MFVNHQTREIDAVRTAHRILRNLNAQAWKKSALKGKQQYHLEARMKRCFYNPIGV
jgi:hypothetical protein